jgi:hypothetical protein
MPSNRLALLSVAAGSALLGWATAGVSAIGADLPKTTTTPAVTQQQPLDLPHHDHHRGHHGRPGV